MYQLGGIQLSEPHLNLKHINLSICIFSADSSSEYAFATHNPSAEDRLDQRSEELVDFVRYLAFLRAVKKTFRGSPIYRDYFQNYPQDSAKRQTLN